jgi:arylsulfatase A-like enzyme
MLRSAVVRCTCFVLFAGLAAFGKDQSAAAEPRRKPNVLIIVADDLGYADVGFQGCKDIPTPHINRLAAGGVRCTNAYVSCPVCSPTRAGMMTGRYQQRFGHEFNPGPPGPATREQGLPTSEVTLADVLRQAGYATGLVGKWHLGIKPEHRPPQRGFDEFFGFLGGQHRYLDPSSQSDQPIYRGNEPVEEHDYLTYAFAREAVDFIRRHQDHPFLLLLTFNAVHTPMEAPESEIAPFGEIANDKRRTYAGMLSAMDKAMGRVLDELAARQLEQDTLIFFISDNGGPPQANGSRNDPLAGAKGTMWEGGIRVPFVMQWKGRIPAGSTYDAPVIALDIFTTSVAAAGGRAPDDRPIDGVNLLPFVTGAKQDGVPHDALYWRRGAQHAVRRGNMKLVAFDNQPPKLFDLAADMGETRDLAAARPAVVEELSRLYADWNAQLVKPLWGADAGREARRAERPRRPRP